MIVTDIIQRPTGFVKGAAKSGELELSPKPHQRNFLKKVSLESSKTFKI
jgi:hypothetical protein